MDKSAPKWAGSEVGKHVKWKITSWKSKSSSSLFKKKTLDISDINQECVGDCWYLAALVAIVYHPHGTALIKKTMVDCGNGKVIVRLFNGSYSPCYLSLEKSVGWYLGTGKIHASGLSKTGLWPAMLEKAACCMQKPDHKVCDSASPNYKNIEGGQSINAFRMLLGVNITKVSSPNLNNMGRQHGNSAAVDHLKMLFSTGMWNFPGKDQRDALNGIFGWRGVSVQSWQAIVRGLKARKSVLLSWTFDYNTFFQLMNSPGITGLPRDVSMILADYARQNNIFSGASGTGSYSDGALGAFNTIKGKLASGKLVCCGTAKDVGPQGGIGHSGGESMSRGIVGGHAYAVLDTFAENVMARRKYLKVANPWGQYGRMYVDNTGPYPLTPKEQKGGLFWMELTDFCAVVDNLYYCNEDPYTDSSFNI